MRKLEESFRSLLTAHRPRCMHIGLVKDIFIEELALLIKDIVGFEGKMTLDTTKPDSGSSMAMVILIKFAQLPIRLNLVEKL